MNLKNYILVLSLFFSSFIIAQETTYQLSSHILDITNGKPAANVKISLEKQDQKGKWHTIDEKTTDDNGRIKDFLPQKDKGNEGIYRLTYHIKPYFVQLNQSTFYPFIEVVFQINDNDHYHVPITLSPYGYSTYRGN